MSTEVTVRFYAKDDGEIKVWVEFSPLSSEIIMEFLFKVLNEVELP